MRAATVPISTRNASGELSVDQDLVAVEAPLTVFLGRAGQPRVRTLGVMMRTPGDDEDLVAGLLVSEGVIRSILDIERVDANAHEIDVTLAPHVAIDPNDTSVDRAVLGTSACGLCGRLAVAGVDALAAWAHMSDRAVSVRAAVVASLPERLLHHQAVFAKTGGLHAAGLFTTDGDRVDSREDVGRHNAVDKLVGAALRSGRLPAARHVLVVSGRVAYEIVQKAVMAGSPMLVAVGAPSDLAVAAARATRLTLVGFVRDGRYNVYTGPERISVSQDADSD